MLVTPNESHTWYASTPSAANLSSPCCDLDWQLASLHVLPGLDMDFTAMYLLYTDMAADHQRTPVGMPWLIQFGRGLSSKLFSPGQAVVGLLISVRQTACKSAVLV